MATYVISDIHGCFDEFMGMLEKIRFSDADELILAGDYVDRGQKCMEMLRWLEACPHNVHPIQGNHDSEYIQNILIMHRVDQTEGLMTAMASNEEAVALYDSVKYTLRLSKSPLLDFFDYYGGIEELIKIKGATFGDLTRWADMLEKYPYYVRRKVSGRECIVVHAGYAEDLSSVRGKYDTLEDFYLYARQESIIDGGIRHGMIVAGHTPTVLIGEFCYTDGEVFRYYDEEKDCIFFDIDCGCVYRDRRMSARLACLRLEDEETFYL